MRVGVEDTYFFLMTLGGLVAPEVPEEKMFHFGILKPAGFLQEKGV
jgi:hypothetical protein